MLLSIFFIIGALAWRLKSLDLLLVRLPDLFDLSGVEAHVVNEIGQRHLRVLLVRGEGHQGLLVGASN